MRPSNGSTGRWPKRPSRRRNSLRMFTIRDADACDVPVILAMIRELAEYERLSHEVTATAESLSENLFGLSPVARAMMAECGGEPAGYAMYFYNFSTFLGR